MSTSPAGAIEPSAAVAAARERAESVAAEQAAVIPEQRFNHLPSGPLEDPANWRSVRDLFSLRDDLLHLNAGTMGSAPSPVLAELGEADRAYAAHPADPYPPTTLARTRGVLARSYGCDFDEIAVVQGAADGNARILNGIDLEPGDEVITTTHECYTMHAPLNVLHNRRDVVVTKLTPPLGPHQSADEIVAMFEAAITSRTKVLEWAGVTFTVGTTFPTRALAELAHRHGLISIVDGAHLPGQFELDLHGTGVDFLSGSGAKYQCGPMGTGIVYARNKVLPEYNPLPLPEFWPVISLWYPIEGKLPRARRAASTPTTWQRCCRRPAPPTFRAAPRCKRPARSGIGSAAGTSSATSWA
ncbi:aminotransferase class V-fold PLP-dependent enzyme [Saccharopolyspora sp. CA-218241]|uniref:aminotransferase class V-fold PLP-dependent enzyme n=1 Tax=Saccharopolyspora sp. CA-218241 TaxID=3240027 RepID=UPI003D962357